MTLTLKLVFQIVVAVVAVLRALAGDWGTFAVLMIALAITL